MYMNVQLWTRRELVVDYSVIRKPVDFNITSKYTNGVSLKAWSQNLEITLRIEDCG